MPVPTTPTAGIGITLGYKLSGATIYTTLGEIMDDFEFDGFDTTIIPIPTIAQKNLTKTAGRTDFGTLNGSMYLIGADAGVQEVVNLAALGTVVGWQVQLPDGRSGASGTTGTTFQFNGFVSNIKPGNFTGDDAPHLDFTIAISGAVTMGNPT